MHVHARCRKPIQPPPILHVAWHGRVHAGVAVPGTFVQTAAQPGPFSRAKSACHENSFGCGLRARPRWSCLGMAVHPPLPLCTKCSSQATNMLACEPPVVSVVSRVARVGLRDASRRVAECRSLSAMTVSDRVSVARPGSVRAVAVSNVLPKQRPIRCPLVLPAARCCSSLHYLYLSPSQWPSPSPLPSPSSSLPSLSAALVGNRYPRPVLIAPDGRTSTWGGLLGVRFPPRFHSCVRTRLAGTRLAICRSGGPVRLAFVNSFS